MGWKPVAAAPDTVFAPAKINLYLHVGNKRADGYHELESLVVFADVGDELSFAPADTLSLNVDGRFAAALANEADNLVLKAARALAAHVGIEPKARITLTKNLPVSSGIGGGSADAAATLRGLVKLWQLDIEPKSLAEIAASLGADVPACLVGKPLQMGGTGDRLMLLFDFPPLDLLLVNPGAPVSTAEVFRRLEHESGIHDPGRNTFHDWSALIAYLEKMHNDLEAPAEAAAPVIREVIDAICSDPATLIVRMSGSGATCFGIYGNAQDAAAAADVMRRDHPTWWVTVARTTA
ncbi:MAG TPA: 4-(cytidine 5'-diphospho)-2-C-methyl-D-erythritol kinase [Rhizomicrobium sp.]|nr:4-(cytidine 5'-diphospho)-2-C-methyl-D-erythritol kinase [Rhizomicrobium sp.]